MSIIDIVDFDSNKRFSMNSENYRLTKQAKDWQPDGWPTPGGIEHAEFLRQGVVKRFTIGPEVICYTIKGLSGPYRIFVDGVDVPLQKPAKISFKKISIVSYGSINVGKINFRFIDVNWVRILFPNWISRIIDPTWDSLDEEASSWTFGDFLIHRLR